MDFDLEQRFTDIPEIVGQLLQVFENSLGNIKRPSYKVWEKNIADGNILSYVVVYFIWFFWFMQ